MSRLGRAWPVLLPALLSLALCLRMLAKPHVLTGVVAIDDGIYLGAASRLVHGVLPYRDFVFLQPPGIALLMAPFAAVGRAIGLRDALVVARLVTAVVTAANAGLAAHLLRFRGRGTALVAGVGVAVFPLAVQADVTVTLEPYVLFGTLAGSALVVSGVRRRDDRRIFVGAVVLGFALTVKLWAAFPIVALAVVLLRDRRTLLRRVLPGLALGAVVPCAPFALAAPRAFIHDVFVTQAHRGTSGIDALSVAQRLNDISGLSAVSALAGHPRAGAIAIFALLVATIVVFGARWGSLSRVEEFLALAAIFTVVGLMLPPEFFPYYQYFPGVFVVLLAAAALSRFAELTAPSTQVRRAVLAAGVVVAALAVRPGINNENQYLAGAYDPASTIDGIVLPGSCVIYDEPAPTLIANRIVPARSGCPALVDAYGTWLSDDAQHPPPYAGPFPTSLVATWQDWFVRADYVILVAPRSDYIPWTDELSSWFDSHYSLIADGSGVFVYLKSK